MARQRPMRIEDLFQLRSVGRVAISPDGRRVAFEAKRCDPEANQNFTQILVVDAEGGEPRALSAAGRHNDQLPRWSPDGRAVAFLSNRQAPTGLYLLPMDGGEPRRLTDENGAVDDFCWSPDGRRIAFTYRLLSEREKLERDGKKEQIRRGPQFRYVTRLHHKLDGVGWWNGEYQHICVVSAVSGSARPAARQLTRGEFDDLEPRWSPDGKWIAFRSNRIDDPDRHTENADVYLVRPAGGPLRRVTQGNGSCRSHSWSPDGRRIAFVGDRSRPGEWWKHLAQVCVVDARGGPRRPLTADIDNHCSNTTLGDVTGAGFIPAAPLWSRPGDALTFVVSERGAVRLFRRGLSARRSECVVGGDINILFVDQARPDGPIAMSLGDATNPGDVYLSDPARGYALRRLTHLNEAALRRVAVGRPGPLTVRSDGHEVCGWELRPPDFDPRRRYPAILQIHGGPHTQYGASFLHEMQFLAARGYVVVFGNPRGSTGRGLRYQTAIHGDWGNRDYRDVMKLAGWLFSRPYVDRARVGVTGGSYGGFMTNWIVGKTNRFAAAVTQRSVVNMESMFGTSDFGYSLASELGGSPWKNVERLRRQSPLTLVQNIRTPLLIEHQENDLRCPIEQGEQLFSALKMLGRTVEMIRFEGESHGMCRIGRPQNRAERLRRIVGWFDRYLKKPARR